MDNQPLVELSKILLLSTHLKLGLMKNFVKAMNQEEAAFTYEKSSPRLSEAKVFSLVHKYETLSRTNPLTSSFKVMKRHLGTVFKFVVKGFLGNRSAQNYEELVNNFLQSYRKLGCNM